MSGSNALQITDPNADNPLAQAPSWADAAGSVAGTVSGGVDALGQWLAAQRAKSQQMGLWNDQTGLPTGAGIVNAAQQTSNALLMGTTAPGIRAFHGSPYDFERFDTSKIGTGEGAQAYGHGLYFAEGEGTARSYRDTLADQNLVWPNDEAQALHAQLPSHLRQQYRSDIEGGKDPTDWLNRVADGAQRHAEYVQSGGKPSVNYGPDGGFALADTAKQLADQPLPTTQSAGKMYEVNIGADPEQFLHWDKPLSEQHPDVQAAVQKVLEANPPAAKSVNFQQDFLQKPVSGQGVYAALADWKRGSQLSADPTTAATVSQQLRDAGIPGIRYLDQGSRGAGEGTHNYVVFDANTIDILRKYGLAGLGIGLSGAAATNGSQQPPMAQ